MRQCLRRRCHEARSFQPKAGRRCSPNSRTGADSSRRDGSRAAARGGRCHGCRAIRRELASIPLIFRFGCWFESNSEQPLIERDDAGWPAVPVGMNHGRARFLWAHGGPNAVHDTLFPRSLDHGTHVFHAHARPGSEHTRSGGQGAAGSNPVTPIEPPLICLGRSGAFFASVREVHDVAGRLGVWARSEPTGVEKASPMAAKASSSGCSNRASTRRSRWLRRAGRGRGARWHPAETVSWHCLRGHIRSDPTTYSDRGHG